jgi:hypothetical protein
MEILLKQKENSQTQNYEEFIAKDLNLDVMATD